MIKEWTQGEKDNAELFGFIGGMIVQPLIHDILGASVSGVDGDVWLASDSSNGKCDGFCQFRVGANGVAHIRYAFSAKEGTRKQLVKAALAAAKARGAMSIYTNDRKADDLWPSLGFKKVPTKRKGEFVKWEMK